MPRSTRRSFLAAMAAAPLFSRLAPRRCDPLRILVLGGTGFLGPHFVRAATANGHSVTLFNRGKTAPGLFPGLEQLRGDREKGDLAALQGRSFDAVVDTSGYVPAHVEATAKLFADKARHYQFVSSVSVYRDFGRRGDDIDEGAAVGTIEDDKIEGVRTIAESMPFYGPLKARCEAAAESAMPGKVSTIRPGLIVGPGDSSDRFTWWPVRIDRGGAVLAPGEPDAEVQFVDVRDLAEWMLHCLEQQIIGVHNAVGFAGRLSMGELLAACKGATASAVELVWASEEFLLANQVQPWMQMPLWIPKGGRGHLANGRAVAHGMTFRPIADTIRDTLEWAKTARGDKPFERTGVPAAREAELLQKWRAERGR